MQRRRNRKATAQDKGPVRVLIEQSPHRIVGGSKADAETAHPIEWESELERQTIILLMACSDVTALESQPDRFQYEWDGKVHTNVPDLSLLVQGVRHYIEVKAIHYLVKPGQLEKYLAVSTALKNKGHEYHFITDDQLPPGRVRNAELLKRFRRAQRPSNEVIATAKHLLSNGAVSVETLVAGFGTPNALAEVYTLIAHRDLCIDWDQTLNRTALVSLPGQPFEQLTYEQIRNSGRFADLLAELALGRRPTDQRLRAVKSAPRRPLSAPSPFGCVGGVDFARTRSNKPQTTARATSHDDDEPTTARAPTPNGDRKQANGRA